MRGNRDLEVAVGGAVACALVTLLLPFELLRMVAAVPLTLLLPGYAISSATFARRPLGRPHLLILSVGLSLITLVLGSLLLNYVPGGLRSVNWALLLVFVVLGASRAAALRRHPRASSAPRLPRPRVSALQAGILGGGLVAIVIAFGLAFTTLPAKNALGYTELWMLPRDDGVAGLEVGLRSQEQQSDEYLLQIRVGDGRPAEVHRFSLDPGEGEEILVQGESPAASDAEPTPVTATVFLEEARDEPYRRVTGWLPRAGASP